MIDVVGSARAFLNRLLLDYGLSGALHRIVSALHPATPVRGSWGSTGIDGAIGRLGAIIAVCMDAAM